MAREYWNKFLWRDPAFVWRQWLLGLVRYVLRKWGGMDIPGLDAWHILGIEKLIETSARVIARYVLVDLLEVAQPINLPLSAGSRVEGQTVDRCWSPSWCPVRSWKTFSSNCRGSTTRSRRNQARSCQPERKRRSG